MSKISALKKALKTTGKIAAGAAAGKLAYDGLKGDSKPATPRKNPHQPGTKEWNQWEIDMRKSRTGKK